MFHQLLSSDRIICSTDKTFNNSPKLCSQFVVVDEKFRTIDGADGDTSTARYFIQPRKIVRRKRRMFHDVLFAVEKKKKNEKKSYEEGGD